MVGTFCETCTVTGYPCFNFSQCHIFFINFIPIGVKSSIDEAKTCNEPQVSQVNVQQRAQLLQPSN